MSDIRYACVNQIELIGKIIKPVEEIKTQSGKPCVKMRIETERFVITGNGKRSRIAQTHDVFVSNSLSVSVMAAAKPGTVVRVLGELRYQAPSNRAEIFVDEYLGQASLMAIPVDPASIAAKAPEQEKKEAAKTNAGGIGKLNVKPSAHSEIDDGNDDIGGDERISSEDTNDFLNNSIFEQSNDFDDQIPF